MPALMPRPVPTTPLKSGAPNVTRPYFTQGMLTECAYRELKQREKLYARLVLQNKMLRAVADEELAKMRAIHQVLSYISADAIRYGQVR